MKTVWWFKHFARIRNHFGHYLLSCCFKSAWLSSVEHTVKNSQIQSPFTCIARVYHTIKVNDDWRIKNTKMRFSKWWEMRECLLCIVNSVTWLLTVSHFFSLSGVRTITRSWACSAGRVRSASVTSVRCGEAWYALHSPKWISQAVYDVISSPNVQMKNELSRTGANDQRIIQSVPNKHDSFEISAEEIAYLSLSHDSMEVIRSNPWLRSTSSMWRRWTRRWRSYGAG